MRTSSPESKPEADSLSVYVDWREDPYLQGIDSTAIIDAVHAQRASMVPVDASLRL